MKTISDRIILIKKELDELESHVNTTLSILDCKSIPLKTYPDDYRKFTWEKYDSYSGEHKGIFDTEEEATEALNKYKKQMDEIYEQNKKIIEENKITYNKIYNFFIQLGLSPDKYTYTGTGKKSRSYKTTTDWVNSLQLQYPMIDKDYNLFSEWYKSDLRAIEEFYRWKRQVEETERRRYEDKVRKEEEYTRKMEEREKMRKIAVDYLTANGKILGKDFTNESAIEYASKEKDKPQKEPQVEEKIEHPKIDNSMQFLDLKNEGEI